MKALESALWRFGIECPRRQVMRREVVEQRAGDGGFAHASLVRTHHDHRRLRHGYTSLAAPRHESGRVVLLIAPDDCGRIGRITLISPCVSSTHPVRRLEALPSRVCAVELQLRPRFSI